ncbi:MAG: amidohydrolase, partial [Flavitalea sp.]
MNRIKSLLLALLFCCTAITHLSAQNDILLKNYRPVSIYHVQKTDIQKASYPVIDLHSHDYAKPASKIADWVKAMDAAGITKTVLLTGETGKGFDALVDKYKMYADRFILYCGFD